VTPTELPFKEIWLHDFEFVARAGERPDVVCLAAHELRSGRTLRLWRDQLAHPPYRTDSDAVFISFVANAECACHLTLGWSLPTKVLDLNPAFRNLTNGCVTPEGKGLLGALRYYGLDAIGVKHKDAMRDRIMQGWPFTPEEQQQILEYCYSDVDSLVRLLPKILADSDFDLGVALYHGEFAAVSASMEHRGVPIDMEIFPQFADATTWRRVRDAMVPIIDRQYGVYVQNAAGDWVFNHKHFAGLLQREGIDWPLNDKGKLCLKRRTFESMAKAFPRLEDLRQLRYARDKMRKVKLAVGADGRNRTVLWPFKSKTGRTQPKAAQWIFSPAVWLRSLIKPAPGMAVAYIDYSAMEFMIAAVLSGDTNMIAMYRSGDPYTAFAQAIGAIPKQLVRDLPEWKANPKWEETRDKYKVMLLSTQYSMGTKSLAMRLGTSEINAHEMLAQHRTVFGQYWDWNKDWVQHSLQTGMMRTAFGWHCRTGITEFNDRSIGNWPVQSTGADILRIACIMAARRGIKLLAPVHDAVLIEAPIDRVESEVAIMQGIMQRASRIVLGSAELRTDAKIIRYPDRYTDKRGIKIWTEVLEVLAQGESSKGVA
jgi:DNA polymerase I